MEVKTQSRVVVVSVLLPLRNKILNGIIRNTSYKLPAAAFVSDLHYYQEGKVGNFTVKAPMILGMK